MTGFEIIVSLLVAFLITFDAAYTYSTTRRIERMESMLLNHLGAIFERLGAVEGRINAVLALRK